MHSSILANKLAQFFFELEGIQRPDTKKPLQVVFVKTHTAPCWKPNGIQPKSAMKALEIICKEFSFDMLLAAEYFFCPYDRALNETEIKKYKNKCAEISSGKLIIPGSSTWTKDDSLYNEA